MIPMITEKKMAGKIDAMFRRVWFVSFLHNAIIYADRTLFLQHRANSQRRDATREAAMAALAKS
jgi:hypothetical protein